MQGLNRRTPDRSLRVFGMRALLAARVKLRVDGAQPAQLNSSVDLRGGDRGMAKDFLNHSQISAAGEKMRRKAVPERMRADVAR